MFIEAILIGIILGFLAKGSFKYFNKLNIKHITLLLVLTIVDLLIRLFIANFSNSDVLFRIYPYLSLAIYIFFIMFLESNKNIKYFRIIESGFILNSLPMLLNNGKMPVSESAMIRIGDLEGLGYIKENLTLNHTLVEEGTRFKILSDIIPMRYIIPKVISVGDIIIAVGLILFIYYYMTYGKR